MSKIKNNIEYTFTVTHLNETICPTKLANAVIKILDNNNAQKTIMKEKPAQKPKPKMYLN
jgi:hypothetical protein